MPVTDPPEEQRLPRTVVPSRYDLTIEPDLEAGTFTGEETVDVTVVETTGEILLNAYELEILPGGRFVAEGGRSIEVSDIELGDGSQTARLLLAEPAGPGRWTLHLSFTAELNRRMTGFYRSTYEDEGTTYTIAVTHLEPTDARRAFPCWDEPDLKAVFGVTLVVPEELTALSNGPEVEREPLGDGRVRVRFQDTMVMSTYLVAFVVGRLELTEAPDARGVPTRIACVPGKAHLAVFALESAVHATSWFAQYYGIPYPDAKIDHVALPDFAQGAMENLGCITYRETLLLADPEAATIEELEDVAETVAHELAHMWFGDLVTMRWWNGIWLNEAFATFMSMLAVDDFRPEWQIWAMFARVRAVALDVDSLGSTRAIEFPVHSPDEVSGMFDTLTYQKGAGILWMLEAYLGADRFRDGIRRYLRTHAYGNTETHDLWQALEEETGEPVRRIMDAWIFQPGYPEIVVSSDGDRVHLAQRRFLQTGEDDGTRWPIPILVRQTSGKEARTDAVLVESDGAELPLLAPEARVLANARSSSFVRVRYDDDLRVGMLADAREGRLSPEERFALVDDAWAATLAGTADAASFLELVGSLENETDLRVWQAMLLGLGWLERFVEGAALEAFHTRVRELLRPAASRLGLEQAGPDEPDLDRALRGALLQGLAVLGDDPESTALARELELAADRDEGVDAHLAAAATQIMATFGNADDYERFRKRIDRAPTPQEKMRYLWALAAFRDAALMERTLADSLSDEIRPQDAPFLLTRATINRDLGWQAWRFVAEHWEEENARFAASNMISLAAGVRYLNAEAQVEEVATFFESHPIPQNALTLEQFLERQRIAAALRRRATPELDRLFG
jgi:aminopeptidase N